MQRPAAPVLRPSARAGLRDMGQGVGAGIGGLAVEEAVGIGRPTDPQGIHHGQKDSGHQPIPSRISAGTSGALSPRVIAA